MTGTRLIASFLRFGVLERFVAVAVLAVAACIGVAIPGASQPLLEGIAPAPADAICNPDPRASGYLTENGNFNNASGGPAIIRSSSGDINSATVYVFLSQLNGTNDGGSSGDKNCGNPVYRYGGLLWLTNSTTATIAWGAWTSNGNSSACYPLWGSIDYMHANSTTTCAWEAGGSPGINYRVLSIDLAPANIQYGNDGSPDSAGDFEFVWDSCSTFYQSGSGTGKVVKTGVPKSDLDNVVGDTTAISWKPGANCGGALTQDGTNTDQTFIYDTSRPAMSSVTNDAGTNSYASSTTATTIWVKANTSGSVTLTPAGTDSGASVNSGVKDYSFGAMGGTTTGWSPTSALSQTGGRTYSWTGSVVNDQSSTLAIHVNDKAGNQSSTPITITLRGDQAAPSNTYSYPTADTYRTSTASFSVTWSDSDAGSGLASRSAQWQTATLSNGTCVSPAPAETPVTPTGESVTRSSVAANTCYRLILTLTDKVGNQASYTSAWVKIESTAPGVPTVTSTTPTGSHRVGDTIFFRPTAASTITLTSDGTDGGSGIASSTFSGLSATTGWTYTPGTVAGDPASKALTWSATAVTTSLSVTTTNNAGLTSAGRTMTFSADATGPTATYSYPTADTYRTSTASFSVTWSDSDAGSGLASRSAQWQTATLSNGTCVSPAPAETPVTPTGESVTRSSVAANTCYRLILTLTDNVGNQASYTSAWVKIDASAPAAPTVADDTVAGTYRAGDTIFFRPAAAGTVTLTSTGADAQSGITGSTFGSLSDPTGWTYAAGFVAGNPAAKALTWSSSAGSTGLSVTVTSGAGTVSSPRSLTFTADAAAPSVSDLSAVISNDDATISWTEVETGSGVARRGLQRMSAAATSAGQCASASYGPDGPELDVTSPAAATNLATGYCYRWQLEIEDRVGNVSAMVVSNAVFVAPPVPSVAVTDNIQYVTLECTDTNGQGCDAGYWPYAVTPSTLYQWTSTIDSCPANGNKVNTKAIIQTGWIAWDVTHGSVGSGNFVPTVSGWFMTPSSGIGSGGQPYVIMRPGGGFQQTSLGCHMTVTIAWGWGGTQWTRPSAWRDAETVAFKGGVGGSFELTADGATTSGTITSNTFGALAGTPTGWTPTSEQSSSSDPYTVTYSWTAGASNTSTSITSTNSGGGTSAPVTRNFTSDTTPPSVSFAAPAVDDFPRRVDNTYQITFSASDAGSGFGGPFGTGWHMRRQKATISNGYCNTFADDWDNGVYGNFYAWGATGGTNLVRTDTLLSDYCYRWLLTATDAVNNVSSIAISGIVMVDVTPAEAREVVAAAQPTASVGEAVWVVANVGFVASGEPVDTYSGTITASSAGAVFPDGNSKTFTGQRGDTGHAFRVLFSSPGTKTVSFSGTGGIVGSVQIDVTSSSIVADAPPTAYVGIPMVLRVAARDDADRLVPNYSGLLTFSSGDSGVTYGGGIDESRQYRMACSCEDGRPFPITFATSGIQTVTVTDEFGNSDQVQVDVLPAPAPIAVPAGFAAYSVEWAYGHTIDYYVKNTTGLNLTVVETSSTCAGAMWSKPTGWGLPLYQLAGDPGQNPLVEPYTSFSAHIDVAECGFAGSQGNDANYVTIVDDEGHKWTVLAQRFYRFSDVPENANFTMLDEGDPLAAEDVTVVARTLATTPEPSPTNPTQYYHVAWDGLTLRVNSQSSFKVVGYSYPNSPFVTFYSIPQKFQGQTIPGGTSDVVFNDIPWYCYGFAAHENPNIDIRYVDTVSGRDGRRDFNVGYPGAAPAGLCDSPGDGHPDDPVTSERFGDLLSFDLDALASDLAKSVESFVGDPVDQFSGSQTAEVTDFDLGGLSPSLTLTRSYRSVLADMLYRGKAGAHAQPLLFGPGWATVFDTNLEFPSSTRVKVRTEGGYYRFDQLTNGTWVANTNTTDVLAQVTGGWTLTKRDGFGLRFDANGRLAALFDANGRELVLGWTSGKLSSLTDPAGRQAIVTTNTAGRITRIDLPGGRYVAYTYDANGHLATVRDLGGTTLTYNVDVRGRITSVQNAGGQILLSSVYDSIGRVIAQTDALGYTTFFNYDDRAVSGTGFTAPDTDVLTRTSIGPRGGASVACYNRKGLLLGSVDAEGGIQTWAYDGKANPIRAVDELGFTTKAAYDAARQPVSMTDALAKTTTMAWDAYGHPATVSSAGTTSTTTFDPLTHLPLSITKSSGTNSLQIGAYTYYPGTNLLETATAEGGAVTTYHYDAYGYVDYVVDPQGRKTTFVTDPNTGLVTSSVGPLGNAPGGVPGDDTTTYTYDDAGRPLTVTDPLGNMAGGDPAAHRTTYTYDAFGRLTTESRASGALTTYVYDGAGQLTSVAVKLTATQSAITTYEYDADGNLTAVVDPEGRRTESVYDLAGRAISVRDPANKVSTLEYDAKGRLTVVTDATGVSTTTTYDGIDRVISVTDGAGKVTTYEYETTTGLLASVTDPLTHTTSYGHDWLGRLESVTNAENGTSSITYDARGFVATVTNARSQTTSFTYNALGQLLTVTEPGNGGDFVTTYTYDEGGRLETRQNHRGAIDTYEYDALGRPTKLTDAVGKIWRTFYTADGDIDHTIDGSGQTTTFAYDLAGRLVTVNPASPTPTITYTYDKSGLVLSMADGAGTTAYGYDGVGRLASVARGGRTTTYGYDDAGRLASVAYPGSQGTVAYGYDTAGRLSTVTDWSARVTTYHYDNASRINSIDRPGGLTTTYTYDSVDRPLTAVSSRAGTTILSQAWTYDANGNIATLTDDTGTASFTYDNLDRLLTATYPGGQTYSYTYDAVGNITEAVTPTGTATYTYDLADRITSSGPAGEPQPGSSTRDPSSDDAGWTASASGYASDDAYATAAPPKNQTVALRLGSFGFDAAIPANATIDSVTVSVEWKVDTADSVATLGSQAYVSGAPVGTELVNATEPTADTTETYTVSGLTRADLVDGVFEVGVRASRSNSNTAVTASLDAVTVTVDYTVTPPPAAPAYDDNGNMTSDGSYGNRTYAYDTLGRLVSVSVAGQTTAYELDGEGNRWSQATDGVTTAFDLDLLAPNPTILSDGTATYLPGAPGAGYEASGVWHSAITDLIGSPIVYVDTAGGTSGLVHYDPYGVPRPGSTAAVGIGYAGEYRDATGLVNLRARSYDPALGRFIGRDTFGGVASAPQTANRYAYGLANPLRYTDPSGHFVQTILENPGEIASLLVSVTVVPGLVHVGVSAVLGFDPISGRALSAEERTFLAVAVAALPGARVAKAILGKAWSATRTFATKAQAAWQRATAFGGRMARSADGLIMRAGSVVERAAAFARGSGQRLAAAARRFDGAATDASRSALGRPSVRSGQPNAGPSSISEAFSYSFQRHSASIEANGLRAGSWATPTGSLSPLQAQLELALPPNRGLPDLIVRIDVAGLREAGYEIPSVTRVGNVVRGEGDRVYSMPGGGWELQFPYPIPPEFLTIGR